MQDKPDHNWVDARLSVFSQIPREIRSEMHRSMWATASEAERSAYRIEGQEWRQQQVHG